jgi:hypothetical protein
LDLVLATSGPGPAEEQRAKVTFDQARRDRVGIQPLAPDHIVAKQELEVHEADLHVARETGNATAFARLRRTVCGREHDGG